MGAHLAKCFFPNTRGSNLSDMGKLEETIGKSKTNLIRAGLGINALWNTYKYFNNYSKRSDWEIYAGNHKNNGLKVTIRKKF